MIYSSSSCCFSESSSKFKFVKPSARRLLALFQQAHLHLAHHSPLLAAQTFQTCAVHSSGVKKLISLYNSAVSFARLGNFTQTKSLLHKVLNENSQFPQAQLSLWYISLTHSHDPLSQPPPHADLLSILYWQLLVEDKTPTLEDFSQHSQKWLFNLSLLCKRKGRTREAQLLGMQLISRQNLDLQIKRKALAHLSLIHMDQSRYSQAYTVLIKLSELYDHSPAELQLKIAECQKRLTTNSTVKSFRVFRRNRVSSAHTLRLAPKSKKSIEVKAIIKIEEQVSSFISKGNQISRESSFADKSNGDHDSDLGSQADQSQQHLSHHLQDSLTHSLLTRSNDPLSERHLGLSMRQSPFTLQRISSDLSDQSSQSSPPAKCVRLVSFFDLRQQMVELDRLSLQEEDGQLAVVDRLSLKTFKDVGGDSREDIMVSDIQSLDLILDNDLVYQSSMTEVEQPKIPTLRSIKRGKSMIGSQQSDFVSKKQLAAQSQNRLKEQQLITSMLFNKSVASQKSMQSIQSSDPTSFFKLGWSMLSNGFISGIDMVQKALSMDQQNLLYKFVQCMGYIIINNKYFLQLAIKKLSSILPLHNVLEVKLLIAKALELKGHFDKSALALLQTRVSGSQLYHLGKLMWTQGNHGGAFQYFRQSYSDFRNRKSLFEIIKIKAAQGDFQKALCLLSSVIQKFPAESRAEALILHGVILEHNKKEYEASKYYFMAFGLQPCNPILLLKLAKCLFTLRDFRLSRIFAKRCWKLAPELWQPLALLGKIELTETGNSRKALKFFRTALTISRAQNQEIQQGLAICLYHEGLFQQSLKIVQKVYTRECWLGRHTLRTVYGSCLFKLRKFKLARKIFNQVLAQQSCVVNMLNSGLCQLKLKNLGRAEELMRQILSQQSEHTQANFILGLICIEDSRIGEGFSRLEKALAHDCPCQWKVIALELFKDRPQKRPQFLKIFKQLQNSSLEIDDQLRVWGCMLNEPDAQQLLASSEKLSEFSKSILRSQMAGRNECK